MSAPPPTTTILVVEDDNAVRMLIVDVLEELGFKVLEAGDGNTALLLIQNPDQIIDLLMTDNGLPDMDGGKLAKQAREVRPALPVLFASGAAETIDVPPGMHLLAKPFSIEDLRGNVNRILSA